MRPAIYTRVSNRDQADGFSLDAQERLCREYCASEGWPEPVVYTDAGRSAFSDSIKKRPAFARLLAAAEAREFDVVVVHKLDRFARNQETALREFRLLAKHGVLFVSISDRGYDFTSPLGKMVFGFLAGMAEYYSSNLGAEAKKGLEQRKLAGYPSPSRPYGAAKTEDGKGWVVDEATAPALARILELAASRSYETAAATLNAEGVPSRRGGPWWDGSVSRVVEAAGWLAHQPPPWPERYAAAAARTAHPPVRHGRAIRMLTGLMRCGHCGGAITYNPHATKGLLNLRCNRKPRGAHHCLPGAPRKTGAAHYEAEVVAWVESLPPAYDFQRAAERLAGQTDPAHAERLAIEEARRRVKFQHDHGIVSDDQLVAEAAVLDAREQALPALPRSEREMKHLIAGIEAFPLLPPEGQRDVLVTLAESVIVSGRCVEVMPSQLLARLLTEVQKLTKAA